MLVFVAWSSLYCVRPPRPPKSIALKIASNRKIFHQLVTKGKRPGPRSSVVDNATDLTLGGGVAVTCSSHFCCNTGSSVAAILLQYWLVGGGGTLHKVSLILNIVWHTCLKTLCPKQPHRKPNRAMTSDTERKYVVSAVDTSSVRHAPTALKLATHCTKRIKHIPISKLQKMS